MKTHANTLVTILCAFGAFVAFVGCGAPKLDLPPDQIQKLGSLDKVMDVQATVADPQFKKVGDTSFADADWAAFNDASQRLLVTSTKVKEFSKGLEFDALADNLHAGAEALGNAANAKDAKAASDALAGIKRTCKTCHSKFK